MRSESTDNRDVVNLDTALIEHKHQIGNFVLEEVIGRSVTSGIVFRARHTFIERFKAVKILLPETARNADLCQRFFDEAAAVCACQHDHIVEVDDCGNTEFRGQTLHYLLMEYLDGESLGKTLRDSPDGRLADLDRLVRIASTVADALAAAHARGIVHRDIQPHNLFLARRGQRVDYVKVLDFGVARLTGDLLNRPPTQTGVRYGTPEYMSPEQARGLHPDGKSDVFSLGVVLYQAITGEQPFWADNDSLLTLKIANDKPVPILKRRPDAPPALVRAVDLAMEKAPEARPTMNELRDLLLDSDAAPRRVQDDITTSNPIVRTAPPKIIVDPARVRTPPAVQTVRAKRRD